LQPDTAGSAPAFRGSLCGRERTRVVKHRFPDLESQLAKDPKLAKHLALLRALRHLAAVAGKTNADADAAYHEVQWAIESLEGRILRESKIQGRVDYRRDDETPEERKERVAKEERLAEEKLLAARPWHIAARLVRIKSYELGIGHPRRSKQKALDRSLKELSLDNDKKLGPADLSPTETRAVELVRGAKATAKKNLIEKQAIAIANAVKVDFSRKRKSGRPAGRRRNIIFDQTNFKHQLRLTATEVIEAVLPIIEELAGPENSSAPGSAMIAAVVAVVQTVDLEPKPAPKKVKAAGAERTEFDEKTAADIVWKLQKRRRRGRRRR
jgi:hypothetical protein